MASSQIESRGSYYHQSMLDIKRPKIADGRPAIALIMIKSRTSMQTLHAHA